MQNRSMFPYRRHGAKKRSKGPARKSRGPQRPLPNSARDLLPMLQPATKALAQMLAGRTGASGQLNHARNLLAHAERLINDRVHNRLTPAEREEFFEQLARLRSTLADADAEAEVQAAEEQVERRPPPPPVAQERLKEMALVAVAPGARPAATAASGGRRPESGGSPTSDRGGRRAAPGRCPPRSRNGAPRSGPSPTSLAVWCCPRPAETARRGDRRAWLAPHPSPSPRSGAAGPDDPLGRIRGADQATSSRSGERQRRGQRGRPSRAERSRRTRKTKDGLPEGWVIDDDGYVVPRHD